MSPKPLIALVSMVIAACDAPPVAHLESLTEQVVLCSPVQPSDPVLTQVGYPQTAVINWQTLAAVGSLTGSIGATGQWTATGDAGELSVVFSPTKLGADLLELDLKRNFCADTHVSVIGVGLVSGWDAPATLDLGYIPPGQSKSSSFLIQNFESRPLIGEIMCGPPPFLAPQRFYAPPIDTASFQVSFRPADAGTFSGQCLLTDALGRSRAVSLLGRGGGPVISIEDGGALHMEAPFFFQSNVSSSMQVAMRNIGTGFPDLIVGATGSPGIEIVGDPAFSLDFDGGDIVPAGDAASLTLTFTPDTQGVHTAKLLIRSNDTAFPEKATDLIGFAPYMAPCDCHPAPNSIDFGTVSSGVSASTTVTVTTQPSSTECAIWNIHISDPWVVAPTNQATMKIIPPGGSAILEVSILPGSPGNYQGQLVFKCSSPSPQIVSVPVMATAL